MEFETGDKIDYATGDTWEAVVVRGMGLGAEPPKMSHSPHCETDW